MTKKLITIAIIGGVLILSYFVFSSNFSKPLFNFAPKVSSNEERLKEQVSQEILAKFEYLSKNGNSSCSLTFRDSIPSMPDNARLQGSCCSPMSLHRYSEQIEGLKRYQDISEIPSNPYDIEARLAKKMMSYYELALSEEEQKAYDYAMQNSDEKGPCCCKCWRWNVYGGLGKYLIREKGFTGEQVTEVWNLSDGCGGDDDHHHVS